MSVPLAWAAWRHGARMSTYRELAPPRPLASVVACTWEGDAGWARTMRVLPDGCVDLVDDGAAVTVSPVRAAPLHVEVEGHRVGIRLRPGVAGPLLGWPANELPVGGVALADLVGPVHAGGGRAALEAFVARRLDAGHGPDPFVLAAVESLTTASIAQAAGAAALSTRALRRRFRAHVGLSPKPLQRVLRFQRALARLGADEPLPDVAVRAGYADQAHLTRECRALAQRTPAQLRAGRNVQDAPDTTQQP